MTAAFDKAAFDPIAFDCDPAKQDGYTQFYGGIGHLLMEMQRAKQLAAITRTIPPPVDRRTAPTFRPVARPQAAPIAPAVDMAAIQKQHMEAAAAAAKVAKKRREEEAILLLAS